MQPCRVEEGPIRGASGSCDCQSEGCLIFGTVSGRCRHPPAPPEAPDRRLCFWLLSHRHCLRFPFNFQGFQTIPLPQTGHKEKHRECNEEG
uniref:Uncharacterized protein n=1 Tax=Anguilla anguilla TaxID=7936 RepID=A0A0E9WA84_ANGAN